jgi:AmiR/NasT family two-component response regulator
MTESIEALVESLTQRNEQLQRALESRIVLEQAKGVLIERFDVLPEYAFEILRRASRTQRRSIHLIAGEVVASRDTPAIILAALAALDSNGAVEREDPAA